jgi:hypothetical protein
MKNNLSERMFGNMIRNSNDDDLNNLYSEVRWLKETTLSRNRDKDVPFFHNLFDLVEEEMESRKNNVVSFQYALP